MKLSHLLQGLEIKNVDNLPDIDILGLADNSRDVEDGFVFVAITGFDNDGHKYIDDAVKAGAALVIGDQPLFNLFTPYIQVSDSRKALGILAKNFYGNPSKQKVIIGITGTNGKTTTSYMLKHILESNGKSCSVIGTIQNIVNGKQMQSVNTTPSSLLLHQLIFLSNDDFIIMEVSSHGLSQHRVEGVEFDFCLFTNLHPEHLDYHSSMQQYFETKLLLFNQLKTSGKAIVNLDNLWGKKLADTLRNKGKLVYTIGESEESHLRIISFNAQKSIAIVKEIDKLHPVFSSMSGIHNMFNTLMAYMTSKLAGINQDDILDSLWQFQGVEGRFEIYPQLNGSTIMIDYAHTADAIFYCLTSAKQQGAQRIVHILGFRGNRDSTKRKVILSVTAELSNRYILTLDDLNSVSTNEMIETLYCLNKSYGNEKGSIIPDRTKAIKQAMNNSQPGDWIIITGKGHEKYQQNYQLPTESDRDTVQFISKQK